MVKVFILTAMFNGGFSMTPFSSAENCWAAVESLPIAIVDEANCTSIEMMVRGSTQSPEMAPMPFLKPGEWSHG